MMTSIPLSSALTSRAGVLAGRLGLIVLLAVAIPSRLLNLEQFAGKFDEGIRGTQLMLMAAGYRPFRDIFASQGPLSLDVFYPTYMLFGQTLGAARLAPALFSIVGIVVAAWTARQRWRPGGRRRDRPAADAQPDLPQELPPGAGRGAGAGPGDRGGRRGAGVRPERRPALAGRGWRADGAGAGDQADGRAGPGADRAGDPAARRGRRGGIGLAALGPAVRARAGDRAGR